MKTLLMAGCLVVATTFAGELAAQSQTPQGKSVEPLIPIIQLENVPLSDAIETLARQAAINFTVDPEITSAGSASSEAVKLKSPVKVRWENLTAKAALARLLKEHGLFTLENPQTGVTRITVTNSAPRVFEKELFSGSKETLPRIQMDDTPLEMALAQLGAKANLKLELDSNLTDPAKPSKERISVSVKFKDLTAGQALAAICDQHSLYIAKRGQSGVWHVSRGN